MIPMTDNLLKLLTVMVIAVGIPFTIIRIRQAIREDEEWQARC